MATSDINVLKLEMRPFIKRGFATGPGNVGGTTLVDATLVEAATFWNDCWVLLRTGDYAGELRRVTASVAGTLTLDHTVGGQIAAGVQYVMLPTLPTDPIDRAARLLGIIYGDLGQVLQIIPADTLAAANSLRIACFPHVYDPVAADWNRIREGSVVGSVLVDPASPTAYIEGQFTLDGAAQQLPDEPCKSVTLENPTGNAVVCIGHDNTVTLLNGYRLWPGATKSMDIDNVNRLWVIGTLGEIISYGGVN